MTAVLTTLLVCLAQVPDTADSTTALLAAGQESRITFYSSGLMESVARKRKLVLPPGHAGWISRPDCSTIGQDWYLQIGDGPARLYRQCDCAQTKDYPRQKKVNLTEVSWEVARDTGFKSRGHTMGVVWRATR